MCKRETCHEVQVDWWELDIWQMEAQVDRVQDTWHKEVSQRLNSWHMETQEGPEPHSW